MILSVLDLHDPVRNAAIPVNKNDDLLVFNRPLTSWPHIARRDGAGKGVQEPFAAKRASVSDQDVCRAGPAPERTIRIEGARLTRSPNGAKRRAACASIVLLRAALVQRSDLSRPSAGIVASGWGGFSCGRIPPGSSVTSTP
jgi:hypothetical protein